MSLLAYILLFAIACNTAASQTRVSVREFGANGDGTANDSNAINSAIGAAARAGGGIVRFPPGRYLSYSIRLRSHVSINLDPGAILIAAEPSRDLSIGYDHPEPNPGAEEYQDFGHSHWHNSLIWGENLVDVSITGPGIVLGYGLSSGHPRQRRDWLPDERGLPEPNRPDITVAKEIIERYSAPKKGPFGFPGKDSLPPGIGNKTIALKNCRNVCINNITLVHGGHIALLLTGCENVVCENIVIDTNRDGINIDSSSQITVQNCRVNSPNDDAICIKSSYAMGRRKAAEDIIISNCYVSGFDEGSFWKGTRTKNDEHPLGGRPTGRIKLGTESYGGFRNITIKDCVFEYCRGLALITVDGGPIEDITISNVTMRDTNSAPVFIRIGSRLRAPVVCSPGYTKNVRISNLSAYNVASVSGILIVGIAGNPVEDVSLDQILVECEGGGSIEDANRAIAENNNGYPDPLQLGFLPSWGLWGRHISGLNVSRSVFRAKHVDQRPSIILEQTVSAVLNTISICRPANSPLVRFVDVRQIAIRNSPNLPTLVDANFDRFEANNPISGSH